MVEERCYPLATLAAAGLQNSRGHRISWGRSKFEAGRKGSRKSVKAAFLSLAHAHSPLSCSEQDRGREGTRTSHMTVHIWRPGGNKGKRGRRGGSWRKRREPPVSCPKAEGGCMVIPGVPSFLTFTEPGCLV